ncbi:MAG: hypothetical protein ACK4Q5_05580 [Saprospiraceae bacterium]
MTIEILKSEALKLERVQLFELVTFLMENLAKEERERETVLSLTEAQKNTLVRRRLEIENGLAVLVPQQEVEAKIRQRYGF